MKRLLSIILSIAMITTMFGTVVLGEDILDEGINTLNEKDEIIREYQKEIINLKLKNADVLTTRAINNLSIAQIQTSTVMELNEAGYEAYDVNPQTFNNIEETLDTNLEDAGLNPNYSYIVLIEGESNNSATSRTAVSSSFTHTYGGQTYTLRWMTVYASDDPAMGKATDVSVLSSTSTTIIQNCLDAVISTYISSISKSLGTVASICGLSVANFAPAQQVTMRLNGATNWTRRYTQVWSDNLEYWLNGCCVEEVTALSYMTGSYYDADTNQYMRVPNDEQYDTRYSSKFNDFDWRKNSAVTGFLDGLINWDTVGEVQYRYNGSTKITHTDNF